MSTTGSFGIATGELPESALDEIDAGCLPLVPVVATVVLTGIEAVLAWTAPAPQRRPDTPSGSRLLPV